MRIELLHIDDCLNTGKALEQVEAALAALGREEVPVHLRRIESSADAAGTGFAGSPTITADGADIFPDGAPSSDLACRIYRTPGGHAGVPTVNQVMEALTTMVSDTYCRCSCCGRTMLRRKLHALGAEPAYICRRCGLWVALRLRAQT